MQKSGRDVSEMSPLQILELFPLRDPGLLMVGMDTGGGGWKAHCVPVSTSVLGSHLELFQLRFSLLSPFHTWNFKLLTGLFSPRSLWEQAKHSMAF